MQRNRHTNHTIKINDLAIGTPIVTPAVSGDIKTKHMNKLIGCLLAPALLSLSGCIFIVDTGSTAKAIGSELDGERSINGPLQVADGETRGDLTTINGPIRMADGSQARHLQAVNGRIELGAGVRVASIKLVNGRVDAKRGLRVSRDIEAVNGGIRLGKGARIGGDLRSRYGTSELDAAIVEGRVLGAHGDLIVRSGSQISGIHYRDHQQRAAALPHPEIRIEAGSQISGELIFERPVRLRVHRSAKIGPVSGAKLEWFGDEERLSQVPAARQWMRGSAV